MVDKGTLEKKKSELCNQEFIWTKLRIKFFWALIRMLFFFSQWDRPLRFPSMVFVANRYPYQFLQNAIHMKIYNYLL